MDMSKSTVERKSLLSLSIAAATADPTPMGATPGGEQECEPDNDILQDPGVPPWSASLLAVGTSGGLTLTKPPSQLHKHRRMSSLGQSRKRISDVREAASRPSAAAVHIAASTLASLATLSMSPSKAGNVLGREEQPDPPNSEVDARLEGMGVSVSLPKDGKKGAIFKCETCSKIYRHPSCLVKHRWEHSPHWRETSKFLLSKHQQVQLLEAAAILSHLAPSARGGASLPEDRALWPAYISGGELHLTTSLGSTPTNATLGAEKPPLAMSTSLPSFSQLSGPFRSSSMVQERAVTSANHVMHVRPGVFSVCRNGLGDSISRTASSPADPRPAKIVCGSSRSKSEGAWSPRDPSVTSRSSYSPPTEDDSDFEMDEEPTLNRTFNRSQRNRERSGGKTPEWDGLEMEMEMEM